MKSKILLSFLVGASVSAFAQKEQRITAYAITAAEKGQSNWNEVRLIDLVTGEEIKKVFSTADHPEILNARTGKPVAKKDLVQEPKTEQRQVFVYRTYTTVENGSNPAVTNTRRLPVQMERRSFHRGGPVQTDQPFATNSAACAYDKKHDRLYYTPMGVNQLRYFDLKARTPTVYYFEDEAFGTVTGPWDVRNQITRMVIGADGIGYALSNSANHLLRFTTNKKADITDLGEIKDDGTNDDISIRSSMSHGGDVIADDNGDLYVITANRGVFKIDVRSLAATYKGNITGLPRGYSTNGATVEKGSTVIVSSASSTEGYYRFDLNTLQAEKLASSGAVFNASDLAGSTLIAEKSKTKTTEVPLMVDKVDALQKSSMAVYPNPAESGSTVKVSFKNQPAGRYTIQLLDVSGQLIESRQVNLSGKMQTQDYRLPVISKGNYLLKVVGELQKPVGISNIVIQ